MTERARGDCIHFCVSRKRIRLTGLCHAMPSGTVRSQRIVRSVLSISVYYFGYSTYTRIHGAYMCWNGFPIVASLSYPIFWLRISRPFSMLRIDFGCAYFLRSIFKILLQNVTMRFNRIGSMSTNYSNHFFAFHKSLRSECVHVQSIMIAFKHTQNKDRTIFKCILSLSSSARFTNHSE